MAKVLQDDSMPVSRLATLVDLNLVGEAGPADIVERRAVSDCGIRRLLCIQIHSLEGCWLFESGFAAANR